MRCLLPVFVSDVASRILQTPNMLSRTNTITKQVSQQKVANEIGRKWEKPFSLTFSHRSVVMASYPSASAPGSHLFLSSSATASSAPRSPQPQPPLRGSSQTPVYCCISNLATLNSLEQHAFEQQVRCVCQAHRPPDPFYDGPSQNFTNYPPAENNTTNSRTVIDRDGASNRLIPDPFTVVLIATTDKHFRVYSPDYSHRPIYVMPTSRYVSEFRERPGYRLRLRSWPASTAAPVDSPPEPQTAEGGVPQDDPILKTRVQPRHTLGTILGAILLLVIITLAHF
ncbi:hypothetical protein BGZ61DRAFT_484017 [Ilyonectria robusta]|uniref:uncharacterized protein n=1 Tax=Ilyonectria robusta TaxID=1079257 RepID=UPI001E8CFE35|nr:uncharacterized protein BGZ61DRAFT_484017 [Ilyonectria robusta]KAH8666078.1 hypothetical protein BGZ61DRAFT_484017 [Ilyonectria robusta]